MSKVSSLKAKKDQEDNYYGFTKSELEHIQQIIKVTSPHPSEKSRSTGIMHPNARKNQLIKQVRVVVGGGTLSFLLLLCSNQKMKRGFKCF